MTTQRQRGWLAKLVRRLAAIVVALIVLGVAGFTLVRWRAAQARVRWGRLAIAELSVLPPQGAVLQRSRADIQSDWTTDAVLHMTNGESILYRYRHGSDMVVHHLFLGRASDGRWLYSSYHFCRMMAMVRGEDAPGSVSEFCLRYNVREFTPGSDTWMKHTWPP